MTKGFVRSVHKMREGERGCEKKGIRVIQMKNIQRRLNNKQKQNGSYCQLIKNKI